MGTNNKVETTLIGPLKMGGTMYKKRCNLDENTLKLKADSQYFNLSHCIISNQSAGVQSQNN